MNKLCKDCKNRCIMYWHGTGKVAKKFVCFIQQDAGMQYTPIEDKNCMYYEKNDNCKKNKIDDNLPATSIPRKLCETCYNWCSQEDVGEYDIPHCVEADYACRDYLTHYKDECQKYCNL